MRSADQASQPVSPQMKFDRGSSFKKGLVLVSVPLISELACILAVCVCLIAARNDLQSLEHERRVMFYLKSINIECARTLLPMSETKDIAEVRNEFSRIMPLRDNLMKLSKTAQADQRVNAAIEQATDMIPRLEHFMQQSDELAHEPGMTRLKFLSMQRKQFLALIFDFGNFSRATIECENANKRHGANELRRIRFYLIACIASIVLVNLIIAVALARFFTRDIVDRLGHVAENARRLGSGKPLYPPLPDSDEIGALDRELASAAQSLTDTRRKELAVLDSASDVISWLNEDLKFVLLSRAAEELWQLKLDVLLGSSLLHYLSENSRVPTREAFQAARDGGQPSTIENVLSRPDGSERTLSWKIVWSQERKGFFCVASDVSALKAVQALKQNFLAMVSHDIRAPLSSLSVSIELLLAGKKGHFVPVVNDALNRVDRAAQRLKHLTDQLLDLGRLESGRESFLLAPVHAFNACAQAKEALAASARHARVSFVGPGTDALVLADEPRLVQAVRNLLTHALQISPEGSNILLTVKGPMHGGNSGQIESGADENGVEISISHRGSGIAADDLPLLLQKFDRKNNKRANKVEQTGLELAVANAIVKAHGGTLGLRNEPDGATTFWMLLASAPPFDDEEDV